MPHDPTDREKPHFDEDLHAAYLATEYTCGRFVLQIGRPHPDFSDFLAREGFRGYAFFTAWNPRSVALPKDENLRRGQELKARLEANDLEFMRGAGHDPTGRWPPEEGYFLFNVATDLVMELAGSWGQNAVVLGARGGVPVLRWV